MGLGDLLVLALLFGFFLGCGLLVAIPVYLHERNKINERKHRLDHDYAMRMLDEDLRERAHMIEAWRDE